MLSVERSLPSPSEPTFSPTLADLSRNASVISTSSSSDSLLLRNPRPIRPFSSPRTQSQSPSGAAVRPSRPPSYLSRQFGLPEGQMPRDPVVVTTQPQAKPRNPSLNSRLSPQDFKFGTIIGEGSYSTVMRATHIATGQEYAIKVLDKAHLIRNKKMSTALAEKNALVRLGAGHPGFVRLLWAFHDEWSLYFVLDLARNGEMQARISQLGSLSTECARYYSAQIVDAVDYMHSRGVIHRDLKPENLLLDDAYRIKITDFGTGKILEPGTERSKTFVGTAQYVAPELLESNETSKSSDLWAFGCILFQMIAGRFAFQGQSEYLTWQKIKQLDYSFPDGFDELAKDLVQRLLVREPGDRLGAGPPGSDHDMRALRSHPFFATVQWATLWTDPAPPLEAGLVKRQPAEGAPCMWKDVGAAWDELVGDDEDHEEDGIEWAEDADPGKDALFIRRNPGGSGGSESRRADEGDPNHKRDPPNGTGDAAETLFGGYQFPKASKEVEKGERLNREVDAPQAPAVSEPINVAMQPRDSSAGSGSSSEGSPIERLGAMLEYMSLKRGRDQSHTSVQGNIRPVEDIWLSLLAPGETILFKSSVEVRSPPRRGSKLITIVVPPAKAKVRTLVLTTQRLVCVKLPPKGRGISIKDEFTLPVGDKGKDGRAVVSVEPKGEREFVVMTSSKSHHFAAEDPRTASTWIQKINEMLERSSLP